MTDYSFGDIVLVPFPFTDQSFVKKRPDIVVSSQDYNDRLPDLILMAVTSQIKPSVQFGEMTISQWKQAVLQAFRHQTRIHHHRERPCPEKARTAQNKGH